MMPQMQMPERLGQGVVAEAVTVAAAAEIEHPENNGVLLEFFADVDATDRLHDLAIVVTPRMAGQIAASSLMRCRTLGRQALLDYTDGLTTTFADDDQEPEGATT